MTIHPFPTANQEIKDRAEATAKEITKRLDEINWDPTLGMPHGGVGDNGVREPIEHVTHFRDGTVEYETKDGRVFRETNDLARYKDTINPDHYKKGDVEVIQLTEKLGFCEGNIVKYVARYKDKGGKDDLLKARWYLDRLIARYEAPADADHYHGC